LTVTTRTEDTLNQTDFYSLKYFESGLFLMRIVFLMPGGCRRWCFCECVSTCFAVCLYQEEESETSDCHCSQHVCFWPSLVLEVFFLIFSDILMVNPFLSINNHYMFWCLVWCHVFRHFDGQGSRILLLRWEYHVAPKSCVAFQKGTDPMGTADAIGEKHRRDLSCSEFCFQGQSQTWR
jgi:hypothetical protein